MNRHLGQRGLAVFSETLKDSDDWDGSSLRLSFLTSIQQNFLVVNGHLYPLYPTADRFDMGLKYKQRKLLFMNQAGKAHKEVGGSWGPALNQPDKQPWRGQRDFDNDGDLDVLINNQDGSPTFLRNDGGNRNHWLFGALRGLAKQSASGRHAIDCARWSVAADARDQSWLKLWLAERVAGALQAWDR